MHQMKYIKTLIYFLLLSNIVHGQSSNATELRRKVVDPVLHYSVSTYVSYTSTMIVTSIKEDMKLGIKYAISGTFTMIPIIGKEWYDEELRGVAWDWADIAYGTAGMATGLILHYFINDKKKIKQSAFNINMNHKSIFLAFKFRL